MRKRRLEDQVYDYLKRQIAEGELVENSKIIELDIAEELAVSRSPVRGAIKRLAREGRLLLVANKGAVVAAKKINRHVYVEQIEVFELLLTQVLFQMESKHLSWSSATVFEKKAQLDSRIKNKADVEEIRQAGISLFKACLEWQKNTYYHELLLELCDTILAGKNVTIDLSPRQVLTLYTTHIQEMITYVEAKHFPEARREVRIWLNDLTLAVIDRQDLTDLKKYQGN